MKTGCLIGRLNADPANVTCRSCHKQGVACPFPWPGGGVAVTAAVPEIEAKKPQQPKAPNKTEAECGHRLRLQYPDAKVRYEPMVLELENGHRYRPDWVVCFPDGKVLCVEVKNAGYKHASYGRSKLAFDQARIDWPMFKWRWAEKSDGRWSEEDF